MARGIGKTTIEWAVRVDVPHPKRAEKAGDVLSTTRTTAARARRQRLVGVHRRARGRTAA